MRINQLTKRDSHVSFVRKGALTLLTSGLALVVFGSVANAQNGDAPAMPMQASSHQPTTVDYRIGPQDVVSITVGNAPEFSGRFRVSDSGMIVIAGIPPVKRRFDCRFLPGKHPRRPRKMDHGSPMRIMPASSNVFPVPFRRPKIATAQSGCG